MQRAQTEAVTFLGNQDTNRSLYAIPGLDYVAQEDILPYTATEKQPLQHELFDKFLMYYPNKGILLIITFDTFLLSYNYLFKIIKSFTVKITIFECDRSYY